MSQVLLVEDDPVLQRAIVRAADGVARVTVAGNGRDAVALAQAGRPQVVLLDFALPDTNGIQVLRVLRADPALERVPVVMFSSLCDQARRREAMAAGATDWVEKPDSPLALRQVVRALCQKYGG